MIIKIIKDVLTGVIANFASEGLKKFRALVSPKEQMGESDADNDLMAPAFRVRTMGLSVRATAKDIYVEPYLTDTREVPESSSQKPWKTKLNAFFIDNIFTKSYHDSNVFCILADTGMGKTTALVNLFKDYRAHYQESKPPFKIHLYSFTDKDVFKKVDAIKNKESCILLLDAVDECSMAQDDTQYAAFVRKLEKTYQDFAFVVTTCRPQFFGEGKEEFGNANIRVGGFFAQCKKLYLDYFNEQQVTEYLKKAYGGNSRSQKFKKAKAIISKCPDAMRPLVLSYIDILAEEDREYCTSRDIYDAIVDRLVLRDLWKNTSDDEQCKAQWLELTSLVAKKMYQKDLVHPALTKNEVDRIVKLYNRKNKKTKGHPQVKKINAQTFRERSMLTRFGKEYRFSHKSFFEYLMAYRFFLDCHEIKALQGMDFAVQIFNELVADWQQNKEDFTIAGQRLSEGHVADSLHSMGYCLQRLNNFKETEKDYKAALEIRRKLTAADPAAYEPDVAMTLNNLGDLHRNMHDYPQAAKELADALEIYKRLAATDPTAYEPYVAMTLNNLGNLHSDMNDYPQAAEDYADALKIYKKLADADSAAYEPDVAMTLNNLGDLHRNMHDYPQAAKELAEALEIYKKLAATAPPAYEPYVAMTLNNLGALHYDMHDYPQAAEDYAEVLEIYRRLADADPAAYEPNVAMTLGNIAILLAAQGHFAEAERNAIESRDIYAKCAKRCHEAYDGDLKKAEEILAEIREMRGKADDTSES